jgi:hypothetical protein
MKTFITTIQIMVFCLFATMATAQNMTLSGSEILIPPGSFIHVSGNLEINGPVTLNNSGEITVAGNWINTGPADFSLEGTSGKVVFGGESLQIITGNYKTTFSNLHLQQDTELDVEVMVSESLRLDDVMLTLGKMDLRLMPGSEIQGAGPMAYINVESEGRLIQEVSAGDVLFPVGTYASYLPAMLSNSGTPDNFGVNMFEDVLTGGVSGSTIPQIANSVANTWVVSEDTPGASDLTLTLWWNQENEGALFDRTQSGIGHYTDGEWQAQEAVAAGGDDPYTLFRTAITQTGAFAVGDISSPMALSAVLDEQVVHLTEGWSGWSSYINPAPQNEFDEVIEPVLDDLIISMHFNQLFYPAFNINSMGVFSNQHGYIIKMATEKSLAIEGTMAAQTITLNAGWNLMPVLSPCNLDADELLGNIGGLIIAFEVAGNGVYYPLMNINTLQTLVPGKAYYVKVQNDVDVSFPACLKNATHKNVLPVRVKNTSPWNDPVYSGASHIVLFDPNATAVFQPGDMIGAFTPSGFCAGLAPVTDRAVAMALFGNDITTPVKDGFADGEKLSFRVFRQSDQSVHDLDVIYSPAGNDGLFAANGLSIITNATLEATGTGGLSAGSFAIYPNPSSGQFFVTNFSGDDDVTYEVMDSRGLVILRGRLSHDGIIDLTGQPKGLYFVRVSNHQQSVIEKLILQ